MTTPRVWLVTGASSGFGRAVTEYVLSKGDIVVAALRKPEMLQDLSATYPKDKLLLLKVDVTNQADVDRAFTQTKEAFGRLDVVLNNAGTGIAGEAEMTPLDTARATFEVNFWATAYVSQKAVKFFREVNEPGRGGVLLQTSSVFAVIIPPGTGFYGASKLAIEGFSEALAAELLPEWNIKVCVIQPGSFATNVLASTVLIPENTVYNDKKSALAATRELVENKGSTAPGDPVKYAKALHSLVEDGNIPLYLPIGQDALKATQSKAELIGKVASEAARWSVDLLRDDM